MSKAIDSCLWCSQPLRVILHTGEVEGHHTLELHVYHRDPSGWISHGNVFSAWCRQKTPMGIYITINALEGKVNDLSVTHHVTLQTRRKHLNGLDKHFFM